jgi:hypothetical protein
VTVFSRERSAFRSYQIVNTVMCTKRLSLLTAQTHKRARENMTHIIFSAQFSSQCSSSSRKIKKSLVLMREKSVFYFILLLCLCFSRSLACPLAQSDSCCVVPQPSEISSVSLKSCLVEFGAPSGFSLLCVHLFFLLSLAVRFLNCEFPN